MQYTEVGVGSLQVIVVKFWKDKMIWGSIWKMLKVEIQHKIVHLRYFLQLYEDAKWMVRMHFAYFTKK